MPQPTNKTKKPFKTVSQWLATLRSAGTPHPFTIRNDRLRAERESAEAVSRAERQSQSAAATSAALEIAFSEIGKLSVGELENLGPTDKASLRLLAAEPPASQVSAQVPGRPAAAPKAESLDALQAAFNAETDPAERGRLAAQMRELRKPTRPADPRSLALLAAASARLLQIRRARARQVPA